MNTDAPHRLHQGPSRRHTARPARPASTPKARVLVLLHPDAFVEVFGDQIDVHVAQVLDVGPADEALAEQIVDATLPARFRPLYFPAKRRAVGQCRSITSEDRIETLYDLAIVRGIREEAAQ